MYRGLDLDSGCEIAWHILKLKKRLKSSIKNNHNHNKNKYSYMNEKKSDFFLFLFLKKRRNKLNFI